MKERYVDQLRQSSRKLIRELGILQLESSKEYTPACYHALIEINNEPGITASKLGDLLVMSPSKISRLTQFLIRDGLIHFKPGLDKREKYLHVTELGIEEIKKIDTFSETKIERAFEFLKDEEISRIIGSIATYAAALEKGRLLKEQIKIATIPTSRTVRKQIVSMITHIQKHEFSIPVTNDINVCVLKAEHDFYYNHSYNFWYATDHHGHIVGSIGLKRINETCAEVKKLFVTPEYRGKGVAQKLMGMLIVAAVKHGFGTLFLGTVDKLKIAQQFYYRCGFARIERDALPENFDVCPLDTVFFQGKVDVLRKHLSKFL